ncbi:hypothetical protein Ahy_A07g036550 [Arachis hypogaea]|uniref:Uncharacterized protein n=1 Tax=Arachis hypogaea TaxID=3818 RepID=A0A445CGE8_ARAHY|nr:hypothetical protein Ahy_A07g036550 [Arachis hypogaea]
MGLGFYMRQKLLNVHIPDSAHLAERVRWVEIFRKEKEKYKNERKLKNKSFSRKEKMSYVAMESSNEESDFETKVDLDELKKGPPYICSLLKKISTTSQLSNNCVRFRNLIQEAIMEGMLKFDDGKKEMKVDSDPFDARARDFETNVPSVNPGVGDGHLEFLM